MLKEYEWHGRTWQFDDGDVPVDAVPVKREHKPVAKAKATANKARVAANKKAVADDKAEN